MPASRIDASLRQVLCWCNGQSMESRYSSSVAGGGAAAAGKLIGGAILRRRLSKARLATAVRMPRFPVVAACPTSILIFDGPVATRGPFATLRRDNTQIRYGGSLMWRRIDLLVTTDQGARSYTMMVLGLFGGGKRLQHLVDELTGAQAGTKAAARA